MWQRGWRHPKGSDIGQKKKKKVDIKGTLRDTSRHGNSKTQNIESWSKIKKEFDNLSDIKKNAHSVS